VANRVDTFCQNAREETAALETPQSPQEAVAFLGRIISVSEEIIDDIEAIEIPEDGRALFNEWFSLVKQITEKNRQMRAAAEDGDQERFQQLASEQQELDSRATDAARAYGFEVCGRGETVEGEDAVESPAPAPSG
jgi:hypothetical protein